MKKQIHVYSYETKCPVFPSLIIEGLDLDKNGWKEGTERSVVRNGDSLLFYKKRQSASSESDK